MESNDYVPYSRNLERKWRERYITRQRLFPQKRSPRRCIGTSQHWGGLQIIITLRTLLSNISISVFELKIHWCNLMVDLSSPCFQRQNGLAVIVWYISIRCIFLANSRHIAVFVLEFPSLCRAFECSFFWCSVEDPELIHLHGCWLLRMPSSDTPSIWIK